MTRHMNVAFSAELRGKAAVDREQALLVTTNYSRP